MMKIMLKDEVMEENQHNKNGASDQIYAELWHKSQLTGLITKPWIMFNIKEKLLNDKLPFFQEQIKEMGYS